MFIDELQVGLSGNIYIIDFITKEGRSENKTKQLYTETRIHILRSSLPYRLKNDLRHV